MAALPNEVRFWAKVAKGPDCWLWQGATLETGYGLFALRLSKGRYTNIVAHKFSYQWVVGPIPKGLQMDHLCRNRGCVRPDHLDLVTHIQNVRRGRRPQRDRTHCPQGHPYDGWDKVQNCRYCTTCKRRHWAKQNAKRDSEAVNRRNRERYANDPVYRERLLSRRRLKHPA